KCHTKSCVNYWKKNDSSSNPPSRFKKGNCPECNRSNVIINPGIGMCNDCGMRQLRLMIQELTKDEENNELEAARIVEDNIQTIEKDLYPERNKNKGGSGLIWILVIVGVAVIGL
ncbi:12062_t:CDS:2, partial [Ambispora gerdemannii]